MNSFLKAFLIMIKAHTGQKDKAGRRYLFHPINVMLGVKGIRTKTVALLHDVLEDSVLYRIDDFGFLDKEQKEALLLLTHNNGIEYMDYIKNLKSNKIAKHVKISDLRHNSNLNRLRVVSEKDLERNEKYNKALKILINW